MRKKKLLLVRNKNWVTADITFSFCFFSFSPLEMSLAHVYDGSVSGPWSYNDLYSIARQLKIFELWLVLSKN